MSAFHRHNPEFVEEHGGSPAELALDGPQVSTQSGSALRPCKGCGELTSRGWCSPSCYRIENDDHEMEG
jgi:hypothetical protein